MPILRGSELLDKVKNCPTDIRVAKLHAMGVPLVVTPAAALQLMRTGNWEGRVRGARVCVLREMEPPAAPKADDSYRFERAVMRFHGAPEDVSGYGEMRCNPIVVARVEAARQAEYQMAVRSLPSGRW